MIMDDPPSTLDSVPHVGEEHLHQLVCALQAGLEGVNAGVEVGIVAIALDNVCSDGACVLLLEKLNEVLL